MDIRAKLTEIQKSRKRRLPINDSSELSEVQLPETNLEEDNDENFEIALGTKLHLEIALATQGKCCTLA
ncbi:hypothetical protein ACQ4LE_001639 [Meloidogyne hapla]